MPSPSELEGKGTGSSRDLEQASGVKLEPADRARCQALRPNLSWSPFALGPADVRPNGEKVGGSRRNDRHWHCTNAPVCIVEEIDPGEDGQRGEMSLCGDCFVQLCLDDPTRARIKEDLRDGAHDASALCDSGTKNPGQGGAT